MLSVRRVATARSLRGFSSIVQEAFGNPIDVLKEGTVTSSAPPKAGEVALKMSAVSLNNIDMNKARGHSLNARNGVVGNTGVGVVTAVGVGVEGVSVKDTVLVYSANGTCATERSVSASLVAPVSSSLPAETLATFPLGLSAYAMLTQFVKLETKNTVIVDNASTPLGKMLADIGKQMGVNVVAHSPAKKGDAPAKAPLVICGDPAKMKELLKSVADNGVLVCHECNLPASGYGGFSIPYSAAIFNNVSVAGFDLDGWTAHNPEKVVKAMAAVEGFMSAKKLTTLSASVHSMKNIKSIVGAIEKDAVAVVKM